MPRLSWLKRLGNYKRGTKHADTSKMVDGKGILHGCVRVPNEKYCANCHLCSAKKHCSFQSETSLIPPSSTIVSAQPVEEQSSSLTCPELTKLLKQATNEKRILEGLLTEKPAEIQRLEDFIKVKNEPDLL